MKKDAPVLMKEDFLAVYERKILARFAWAQDPLKLGVFMQEVEHTLKRNSPAYWNWESELAKETFREIGGKGRMTLNALQSMTEKISQ